VSASRTFDTAALPYDAEARRIDGAKARTNFSVSMAAGPPYRVLNLEKLVLGFYSDNLPSPWMIVFISGGAMHHQADTNSVHIEMGIVTI
jgi:hypothetical protein